MRQILTWARTCVESFGFFFVIIDQFVVIFNRNVAPATFEAYMRVSTVSIESRRPLRLIKGSGEVVAAGTCLVLSSAYLGHPDSLRLGVLPSDRCFRRLTPGVVEDFVTAGAHLARIVNELTDLAGVISAISLLNDRVHESRRD